MRIIDKDSLFEAVTIFAHRTDLVPYLEDFRVEAEDRISSTVMSQFNQFEGIYSQDPSFDNAYRVPYYFTSAIYATLNGVPLVVTTPRLRGYNKTKTYIASYWHRTVAVTPLPDLADEFKIGFFFDPSLDPVDENYSTLLISKYPLLYFYAMMCAITRFTRNDVLYKVYTDQYNLEVEKVNMIRKESEPGGGPVAIKQQADVPVTMNAEGTA